MHTEPAVVICEEPKMSTVDNSLTKFYVYSKTKFR